MDRPGRRSYRIYLTPAGRRAHEAAGTHFAAIRARVADELAGHETEVREALLLLRTVLDGLRQPR